MGPFSPGSLPRLHLAGRSIVDWQFQNADSGRERVGWEGVEADMGMETGCPPLKEA